MVHQQHVLRSPSFTNPAVANPSHLPVGNTNNATKAEIFHGTQPQSDGAASEGGQAVVSSSAADDDESGSHHIGSDVEDDAPGYGCEAVSLYPGRNYHRRPSASSTTAYIVHNSYGQPHSDRAASTRSLWARELDYREIGGRRYCKEYFMPNDEIEQLRLTIQHQVLMHAFDGELTITPLSNPTHVLDVGTGTGEWAIRFAELFPDCEVVGTDISAIQETQGVPMNVFFEIEDAEEWDRPIDHYDLVHLRGMEGAFRDWRCIYEDAFDSLKPGGWMQVTDYDGKDGSIQFFSGFSPESPVFKMMDDLFVGAEKSGRKRGMFHLDQQYFSEAGFVDIRVSEHILRMNLQEDSVGKLWLMCWLDGIEAYSLRTLTEQMGWDADVVKTACRETAREIASRAQDSESCKTMILKMRTVLARKPSRDESPVPTSSSDESTIHGESSDSTSEIDG
ncbi:putative methyltransferase [Metarhizium anisopliae]